jgi:hypothetical protein
MIRRRQSLRWLSKVFSFVFRGRRSNPAPFSSGGLAVAQRFAAIGEGFGDVQSADTIGSVKVSERAGDTQDAVEAACRELHRFSGLAQERETFRIGRGDFVEELACELSIGANAFDAACCQAGALAVAGRSDARADLPTAF